MPPAAVRPDGQNFTVNFAKDATDMPPGVSPFLSGLIKELKADQSIRLQLKGYAGSAEGSPGQARRVSLFRALSVRKYLIKQGIRSTRMDIRALGSKVKKGKPDRVDIEVKK
ncbi:OmpA family protein [Alphaproteobacteria bacterium]|jgi:outer membrane protein OmpA-like peptidoglycan-associated protein|nr:OmpA family protein [Alphaproteobacteria bacterium]